MRIAVVVILVLVLCSTCFAARPDRGRYTPVSQIDKGEEVVYGLPGWQCIEVTGIAEEVDRPELSVVGPQYHGVWFCLKLFYRIF